MKRFSVGERDRTVRHQSAHVTPSLPSLLFPREPASLSLCVSAVFVSSGGNNLSPLVAVETTKGMHIFYIFFHPSKAEPKQYAAVWVTSAAFSKSSQPVCVADNNQDGGGSFMLSSAIMADRLCTGTDIHSNKSVKRLKSV